MYIIEISCLSVASFAIIFSHSEGCLFTLLIVSFVLRKLLILIRSHLFIFAFISFFNVFFYCGKSHYSIKHIIFAMFNLQFSSTKYIYIVVKISPLFIS